MKDRDGFPLETFLTVKLKKGVNLTPLLGFLFSSVRNIYPSCNEYLIWGHDNILVQHSRDTLMSRVNILFFLINCLKERVVLCVAGWCLRTWKQLQLDIWTHPLLPSHFISNVKLRTNVAFSCFLKLFLPWCFSLRVPQGRPGLRGSRLLPAAGTGQLSPTLLEPLTQGKCEAILLPSAVPSSVSL